MLALIYSNYSRNIFFAYILKSSPFLALMLLVYICIRFTECVFSYYTPCLCTKQTILALEVKRRSQASFVIIKIRLLADWAVKVNFALKQATKAQRCTLSLISALYGGGCLTGLTILNAFQPRGSHYLRFYRVEQGGVQYTKLLRPVA